MEHKPVKAEEEITHTAVCGFPHGACGTAYYLYVVCECGVKEIAEQGGNVSSQYAGEEPYPENSHFGRVLTRAEIRELPLVSGGPLHPDSGCPHEGYPCQFDGCCEC
jgi:hypothetical protein